MIQAIRKSKRGFTLIELAIVLAIAGVLFAGLWKLLAGGNQQLRDQAAASSHSQLISAVKAYLTSAQGVTNIHAAGTNASFNIPLPTVAPDGDLNGGCEASIAAAYNLICEYLPIGFSSSTVNSYGQTYSIQGYVGASSATYSFMIIASNGDVIPDTSGGRISSMIGGDGGFIYSTNVCSVANNSQWACGSYGAWAIDTVASYGFAVPGAGSIASRTFYAPDQSSNYPWLARQAIPGDNIFNYNTMTTPFYAGGQTVNMGSYAASLPTVGGTALNMQSGAINMVIPGSTAGGGAFNLQGGTLWGTNSATATPYAGFLQDVNGILSGANVASDVPIEVQGIANPAGHANPATYGGPLCVMNGNSPAEASTCGLPLQVQGNAEVSGLLTAFSLYSKTFVYDNGGVVSDMRMKKNIVPLGHELDRLTKLKTVSFTRLSTDTPGLGVIAQDVEKTYPQLIIDAGGGMKAVDYTGLIAPTIESIKELKDQNVLLQEEVDTLKSDVKAMQTKASLHKAAP